MTDRDIRRFVRERNKALFSLDRGEIIKYFAKYGIPYPKDEIIFWASVHKAICNITNAPKKTVEQSRLWLIRHGFSTSINILSVGDDDGQAKPDNTD